ncbi:MAG: bifunctional metallophosphatase/5'-nucleotidase [Bacteroidales bacterium]|jgi:2',3'-cyclic-nucleotide 2'-phosphodiesterase (5'-nucleotidase family)|nr:bifunctional metallophosphatase/5'-nucleotidase [Bacteroidales bacterium]
MRRFLAFSAMVIAALLFCNASNAQKVKVIFTSDLHSCAEKYPRLTAFINQERAKAQAEGCGVVTLDAGDYSFGSIYSAFTEIDATEYRQLALAGYDAFVFGNHDFDLGLTSLAFMFYNSRIQGNSINPVTNTLMDWPLNITANIDAGDNKDFAQALPYINHQRYLILEKGGKKIGVFGLLGKNAYETSAVKGRMPWKDPVEVAKQIIPALQKAGVDFIIALSHSGALARENSEDARLATECPEINLIVSGHDHEALTEPYMVGNTAIVSAGANGDFIGEVDLDKSASGVTVSDFKLLPVPEDITPDPATQIIFDKLKEKVIDQFGKRYHSAPFDVIDSVKTPLSIKTDPTGFNPMGYDVAKAIFNAAYFLTDLGIDSSRLVAVVPDGVLRQPLPEGNITYNDVFNTLSLGRDSHKNPGSQLVVVFLKGSEIKKICEFNCSSSAENPDTHISFYGLNYTYNSRMPKFFRVKDVYVHGKKIVSSDLYPVVTDLYTANNISLAGEKSHGLLSLEPKNKDGKEVPDIERYCSLRGNAAGWFLDNADIQEWYAYAVYLRDKVILGDSYPVPAATNKPSYLPYIIFGGLCILALILIDIIIRSFRKKKRAQKA